MPTPHNLPTPGVVTPTPLSPRAAAANNQRNGSNAFVGRPSRYIASPPPPNALGPRNYPGAGSGPLAFRAATRGRPESLVQMTPEAKRRRIDDPQYTHGLPRPGNGPLPAPPLQAIHRPSLARPELGSRDPSLPSQRPQPSNQANQPNAPTLAPLRLDETKESATQAKSVEAMVMSIPTINKIKLLAKISPPLPVPGPASPPHATRGALLAVDGNDEEALKTVVSYLKEYLERDDDYMIKLFSRPTPTRCETIAEWKKLMYEYHAQSDEITKYITNIPVEPDKKTSIATDSSKGSISNTSSPVSPKTIKSSKKPSRNAKKAAASIEGDTEMEGTTSDPPAEADTSDKPSDTTAGQESHRQSRQSTSIPNLPSLQPPLPIPIALVPKYQLTLTDAAASMVPIADEYSPIDHWQWMGTQWRGVVGPDVTVDVRVLSPAEVQLNQGPARGGGGAGTVARGNGNGGNGTKDGDPGSATGSGDGGSGSRAGDAGAAGKGAVGVGAGTMGPAVDVKLHEARAVLLRGEAGGKVNEAGLRRMGFEVGEWLRFVGERERERTLR